MSLHLCLGSELCQIRKHFTVMASVFVLASFQMARFVLRGKAVGEAEKNQRSLPLLSTKVNRRRLMDSQPVVEKMLIRDTLPETNSKSI